MEDVTPKLLKNIQDDFRERFDNSSAIKKLHEKIKDGTATYNEANEFAVTVGNLLSASFQNNLSDDVLPDGKMYYNIAERILGTTLENNHKLITDVTSQVQAALNKSAKIGIKPIVPEINKDRIRGLVNRISSEDKYSDAAWLLDEPVVNFSQSIVDDAIKANADFQYNAGLSPKIERESTGKCCDWCNQIVGTYEYPDVPKDVYRRHNYCRCKVDYIAGKYRKNVHNNNTGKRRYVQDKYGGYELSKEARLEHAKQMAATEKVRKEQARQKCIETWKKKKEDNSLKQRKVLDSEGVKEYNTSPAKKLKEMYNESVTTGWLTPLFSYSEYVALYRQIEREIVGKQTSNGILITGISRHFMERIVGVAVDPKIYKEQHLKKHRNGVELEDIKEALFSGKYRKPMENGEGMSQLFYTDKCKVTVNPDTGNLIQCNEL